MKSFSVNLNEDKPSITPEEQEAFEKHKAEALQISRDLKKHFKQYSKNQLIAVILNHTNMIMSLKNEIGKLNEKITNTNPIMSTPNLEPKDTQNLDHKTEHTE